MFSVKSVSLALIFLFSTVSFADPCKIELDKLGQKDLGGLTFSITGKIEGVTRGELANWIIKHGGRFSPEVTSKVNILIYGEKAGSKLAKAKRSGIQTLSVDEFAAYTMPAGLDPVAIEKEVAPKVAVATTKVEKEKKKITAIETVADFNSLSKDDKESILQGYGDKTLSKNITILEDLSLDTLKDKKLRAFAEKIEKFMRSEMEFEVDVSYEGHAKVGSPRVTFDIATLPSGEIVGGSIYIHQKGATQENEDYAYYETEAEAEAAGADFNDVSWSARGYFDAEGKSINHDVFMDWTGH